MLRKLASSWILLSAPLLALLAAGRCHAQQNLFNVPSGIITTPGDVFIQQQFNFIPMGESNTTIDFGVWDEFEAGMNLINVPIYTPREGFTPETFVRSQVLFNAQWGYEFTEDLHFAVGTQLGVAASEPLERQDFSTFDWMVFEKKFSERALAYAGAYYGNDIYLGSGSNFGALLGLEVPLVEDRFSLMGDLITGTNSISVAVIGGVYKFPGGHWQVSLGYLLPFPESGNSNGVVLEITRVPLPAKAAAKALFDENAVEAASANGRHT
jgi:hypothetical protein